MEWLFFGVSPNKENPLKKSIPDRGIPYSGIVAFLIFFLIPNPQ